MIYLKEKIGPFTIIRTWFKKDLSLKCTLLRLTRINEKITDKKGTYCEPTYTAVSDLKQKGEELFMCARSTVRNEIRRAEKDNFEISCYNSKNIKENIKILNEFEEAYKRFADELKNDMVTSAFNKKKIYQLIDAECFCLTVVKKDALSVYHAYVYDSDEVVLIFSVSDYRDDRIDKSLAGRANKYLHFQDMLMFKELGLSLYDWGNISNPDAPNGIDNFKLSFGGIIVKKYNILIGQTIIGRVAVECYRRKRELIKK